MELLIVIIVIGILVAIAAVNYLGLHTKAIDTSLQSDLNSASTQLELDKTTNDLYPSAKEEANGSKGLRPSVGTAFDYIYSGSGYCLTATKGDRSYYLDSTNRFPRVGTCQTGSFARTWGGTGADSAEGVVSNTDGGYAITGFTFSFGSGGRDAYITKYTADGTLLWNKTWGGTGVDNGNDLIQTSDGGYAVTGYTESFGAGSGDSFIAKYTADGTLSWSKTWGGSGVDNGNGLIQTSDGGYAVAGYTESFGAGIADAFIAKYTSEGNLSWSKTWGGADYDNAFSLSKTSDGEYLIAGDTESFGAGSGDAFIAKYTSEGNLSWSKTWGGANWDAINSIIQSNDGGSVLSGVTGSFGAGDSDAYVVKYANDGTLSWNRTWGGTAFDGSYSITQSTDGGYISSGQTMSYGSMDYDGVLIKFDSNGYISNCPALMCQSPSATVTSPAAIVNSPNATVTSPTVTVTSPTITGSSPSATMTNPIAIETATKLPMTVNFSSQELYVAYPGISKNTCKQWTVPIGKQIKGFKVSQATEANYDFFRVYLDNVLKYNMSGTLTDRHIDTSANPGTVLKACMNTDEAVQEGYGGEVTGVIYN